MTQDDTEVPPVPSMAKFQTAYSDLREARDGNDVEEGAIVSNEGAPHAETPIRKRTQAYGISWST